MCCGPKELQVIMLGTGETSSDPCGVLACCGATATGWLKAPNVRTVEFPSPSGGDLGFIRAGVDMAEDGTHGWEFEVCVRACVCVCVGEKGRLGKSKARWSAKANAKAVVKVK